MKSLSLSNLFGLQNWCKRDCDSIVLYTVANILLSLKICTCPKKKTDGLRSNDGTIS
jgi:hypothetical protein